MRTLESLPVALCTVKKPGKGQKVWQIIVPECPLCRKKHEHHGGPASGDYKKRLTTRTSHCYRGVYRLQEISE